MKTNLIVQLSCCFFLIIFSVSQESMAQSTESFLEQQHGQWNSRIVTDGDRIVYRALVSDSSGSEIRVLKFDRIATNCQSSFPEMIIGRKTINKQDLRLEVFGQIRIDESPIRNALFELSAQKAQTHYFVTIKNWDRSSTFFTELTSGNTIRLKLTLEGDDFFYRFPLNGSSAALARARDLCERGARTSPKERKDEDFFKSIGAKQDKDFFGR